MSLTAGLGAPCFQALTRPVSMMGLPLTYVVLLAMAVMGGFIATLSFAYLAASAVLGYALYQERQNKDGIEISIGERGISVEKK